MKCILAIETATEACSVALWRNGEVKERHEVTPRQHSQRLFSMLRELFPGGRLREQEVEAIAYGCGPGSFTGLRVAASAVQGLAFTAGLPAIAVSTLACQAQVALRTGLAATGDRIASLIDARINEVYCAIYTADQDGTLQQCEAPSACAPDLFTCAEDCLPTVAVGSGARFLEQFPTDFRRCLRHCDAELLPRAGDLVPLALAAAAAGELQTPLQVRPMYVREDISWKKIPEQGRRA